LFRKVPFARKGEKAMTDRLQFQERRNRKKKRRCLSGVVGFGTELASKEAVVPARNNFGKRRECGNRMGVVEERKISSAVAQNEAVRCGEIRRGR